MELTSSTFESEDLLQTMIERYPQILAGDQVDPDNPRRWLVVLREAGIPDAVDSGTRWSLDHLLVDQEGVPTLVEVKRSTDTRIRREVVGQMLDYAANAVAYWPVDSLRSWFEARCESAGEDPYQIIAEFTNNEASDEFWQQVKTNLQARRLRLVFVADAIPRELRRIIEFLNEQMDPTEVIGIELKRYVGNDGLEALVPRVIGQTASAEGRKKPTSPSGQSWTPDRFFTNLGERVDDDAVRIAQSILEWAERVATRIFWGRGKSDGSFIPVFVGRFKAVPFSVWTSGRIEINFQYLRNKEPFQKEETRRTLAQNIMEATGASIPETALDKRPSFSLHTLAEDRSLIRFLEIMMQVAEEVSGRGEISRTTGSS